MYRFVSIFSHQGADTLPHRATNPKLTEEAPIATQSHDQRLSNASRGSNTNRAGPPPRGLVPQPAQANLSSASVLGIVIYPAHFDVYGPQKSWQNSSGKTSWFSLQMSSVEPNYYSFQPQFKNTYPPLKPSAGLETESEAVA